MATYLCDDGGCEVTIEADSAREAAQEYVDGGDWGTVESTTWINVYVQELSECEHASMTKDTCDECGETCSTHDEVCADDECPIHGNGHVGERKRIKIALDPTEPKCCGGEHDWQSPHEILGGLEENPGVWGHGGGVIVREVCMHCGCERTTDTWAQDRETGEQGLESVSYEPGKYEDEVEALRDVDSDAA